MSKISDIEVLFREKLEKEFVQLPSGKWQINKVGNAPFVFLVSADKNPVVEFIEQYPSKYQQMLDDFFDKVHPY